MFSGMQLNDSQPGASPAAATQADARAEAGGPPAPPLTAAEAGGSSFSFMNGGAAEAAPSMNHTLSDLETEMADESSRVVVNMRLTTQKSDS